MSRNKVRIVALMLAYNEENYRELSLKSLIQSNA